MKNLKQRVTQTDGLKTRFFKSIDEIEKYLGGLTKEITNIRRERGCNTTVSTDSNGIINKQLYRCKFNNLNKRIKS